MTENNDELLQEKILKVIGGEIVVSSNVGEVLKKWRTKFEISQKGLAKELDITPSVVCDYESGRRKSPGIKVVKKYIDALISLDNKGGGKTVNSFRQTVQPKQLDNTIVNLKEFFGSININDFCKAISADFVVGGDKEIYGYTVIDSIRAITELSFNDLAKLYGNTTQRALIFTRVSTGRTPVVAIKLTNMKPGLVVLHGLTNDQLDPVAKEIALRENIPLAICNLEKPEELIERLQKIE